MRAFHRVVRAWRLTAIAVASAGALGCGYGPEPGPSEPLPPVTAADVSFDALRGASVLVRGDYDWRLIDGETRTVRRLNIDAGSAALSPDGSEIAFVRPTSSTTVVRYGVFVARRDGSATTRLTGYVGGRESGVAWSPDGEWVYFVDGARGSLIRVRRDGTATETLATHPAGSPPRCPVIRGEERMAVSASGEVAFACLTAGIYVVGPQGTRLVFGEATPNIQTVGSPAWSADGTQIAFQLGGSSIRIVDAATGNERATIPTPEMYSGEWMSPHLCWLPDAGVFVVVAAGYALHMIDPSGNEQATIARRAGSQLSCAG